MLKMERGMDSIILCNDFVNWRWFSRSKILQVFLWLLMNANTKTEYYEKDEIKRGSLATNNAIIAEECWLTTQNVRTALMNLEHTGEIKRERRNHYQIITIVNYELYATDPD